MILIIIIEYSKERVNYLASGIVKLVKLLSSIGFVMIPQYMPKKDVNDTQDYIDTITTTNNDNDIESKLNRIILELPDQRVHHELYHELRNRLKNDNDENYINTKMITTIDKECLLIYIKKL